VIYYGNPQGPVSFRRDLPLLIVRAGLDGTLINRGLETMISAANAANAPVSVINYASGHHGFDLYDDNSLTRSVIDATLEFVKSTTRVDLQQQRAEGALDAAAASALFTRSWDEAIHSYEKLLEQRPDSADLEGKLGEAYFGAKQYSTAIAHYDKALKLGSKNIGMISYAAAVASLRMGDKQQALTWLAKVAEIAPMRAYALSDPELEPLHDDPRFNELFQKP
jgi:tetratricopeptide (TPR) repeat protein